MNRPTFRSDSGAAPADRRFRARPAAVTGRAVRGAGALFAALALSGCAGMTFQLANTVGYTGTHSGRGVTPAPIDLSDPASPVNIWNIL